MVVGPLREDHAGDADSIILNCTMGRTEGNRALRSAGDGFDDHGRAERAILRGTLKLPFGASCEVGFFFHADCYATGLVRSGTP